MPRTRPSRGALAAVAAGILVVAASGTGATYAAFSDFDTVTDNQARAARVALGLPGVGAGPELAVAGLLPGESRSGSFDVSYVGTIPADLALELRPRDGSAWCDPVGDTWVARPGGAVEISFGAEWRDYCGLLGSTVSVPVGSGVAPGTDLTVPVSVRLAAGTDHRYSELSDADRLTVTARQSSLPDGGFTDFAVGSITISTGRILPAIPAECVAAGLTDFDDSNTVVLDEGDNVFATPHQPAQGRGYLVFGLGGDDVITGSNQADCLVGGDGDDTLTGGNQHDVLVGGEGDDTLANDDPGRGGGNGKDRLYGGPGDDVLRGGNGPDLLDGGDGHDTCFGGHGPDLVSCEVTSEDAPLAPLSLTGEPPTGETTEQPPAPDGPPPGQEPGDEGDSATEPEPPVGPDAPDETDEGETEPEGPTPPAGEELPPGEDPVGDTS